MPEYAFSNAGTEPLMVPGFGLPLTADLSPNHRFAHPFYDWYQDRLTAREVAMLDCMNLVTDQSG